jgi:hypothetical protein
LALGLRALINPPQRLRVLSDRSVLVLRPLWVLVILFATAAVILGTTQALHDTYEVRPAFTSLGLDYEVEDSGAVSVDLLSASGPADRWSVVAVDGLPVDANASAGEIAQRLKAAEGPTVAIDLASPGGKQITVHQKRDSTVHSAAARQTRELRIAARLSSGLLACGVLILCSVLLVRRRPHDPVAMLFAFAFAGMASTIDPPMAMWMAMGWPVIYDIISSVWFYLLLIALAVFPDGIFVPKIYRWLLVFGVPLAVFVSLPEVPATIQVFVGLGALLAMLVGQSVRYRRLPVASSASRSNGRRSALPSACCWCSPRSSA